MTLSDKSNKDLNLKLITSRIFKDFGYATWLEVDFFVSTYSAAYSSPEVTDFDVVGISFDGDLSIRSIVAECKTPERRSAEDLLKLLGSLHLFGANRGYLVKERIADNAREVANEHGIACLDHEEALRLLNSLEKEPNIRLESERRGYDTWKSVMNDLRNDDSLTKTLRYLRRGFWTNKTWENLNTLFYVSRTLLLPNLNPENTNHCALIIELCRLFNISILGLCNSVLTSRLGQIEREIEVQLFGGSKSRRTRERFYDEIARALPKKFQMPSPLNPPYLPQLKEVVSYYLMSPLAASKTPMVLQQVLFQNYLGIKDMYYGTPQTEFSEDTIKLAKDSSELLVNSNPEKGKKFLSQLLNI